MSQATVFDLVQERSRDASRVAYAVLAVILGSLLIALSARVQFPIPGTAVPFTLQTLVVVALGMVLGPRLGAAACALYLAEVIAMPAMSASGRLAITGGFIVGFIPSAWLAGTLFRAGWGRTSVRALVAMVPAKLVVFAIGVPWMLIAGVPVSDAWPSLLATFGAIEVAKILVAMASMRQVSAASTALESRLGGE